MHSLSDKGRYDKKHVRKQMGYEESTCFIPMANRIVQTISCPTQYSYPSKGIG